MLCGDNRRRLAPAQGTEYLPLFAGEVLEPGEAGPHGGAVELEVSQELVAVLAGKGPAARCRGDDGLPQDRKALLLGDHAGRAQLHAFGDPEAVAGAGENEDDGAGIRQWLDESAAVAERAQIEVEEHQVGPKPFRGVENARQ